MAVQTLSTLVVTQADPKGPDLLGGWGLRLLGGRDLRMHAGQVCTDLQAAGPPQSAMQAEMTCCPGGSWQWGQAALNCAQADLRSQALAGRHSSRSTAAAWLPWLLAGSPWPQL